MYTPLKMATKGNCTGDQEQALVTAEESLNIKKLAAFAERQARQDKLAGIVKRIQLKEHSEGDTLQHSYCRPAATDAVLYYLGGYIVKKASRFSDCDDCKATVKGSGNVPAAAILTEMRSFVPGALQHPSDALTCLLSGIEQVIEENTEAKQVFGDLFWSILEDLSKKSLVQVGCDVHSEEFSARVIKSYLVTRMYF